MDIDRTMRRRRQDLGNLSFILTGMQCPWAAGKWLAECEYRNLLSFESSFMHARVDGLVTTSSSSRCLITGAHVHLAFVPLGQMSD